MTKLSKLIYHPLFLVGVTFVSFLFFLSLLKTSQQTQLSTQNTNSLQNQRDQEAAEVQATRDSLAAAKNSLNREKIIRDELLMRAAGEYIVQISDEDLKQSQNLKNEVKISQKTPWDEWRKLLLKI